MNNKVAKRLRKLAILTSPSGQWRRKYKKLKTVYVPMPNYTLILDNLIKQSEEV